ncbi:hypothetical protein EJD97_008043, partial [Solanum chilense]
MKAIHLALITHLHHHKLDLNKNRIPMVHAYKDVKTSKKSNRLGEKLSNLLNIQKPYQKNDPPPSTHSNLNNIHEDKANTPTMSPKEDISDRRRDIHGVQEWEGLLDPPHPLLLQEIVKYGEFAQATYDALDIDSFSEYCVSCMYNSHKLFDKLGLNKNGYRVTKYIYAMSQIHMPQWL